MSEFLIGLIGIAFFFGLLILRMPIAFAMALVGFVGFGVLTSIPTAFDMVAKEILIRFLLIR
jgi:xanthosine utilization system XapX-like protein